MYMHYIFILLTNLIFMLRPESHNVALSTRFQYLAIIPGRQIGYEIEL